MRHATTLMAYCKIGRNSWLGNILRPRCIPKLWYYRWQVCIVKHVRWVCGDNVRSQYRIHKMHSTRREEKVTIFNMTKSTIWMYWVHIFVIQPIRIPWKSKVFNWIHMKSVKLIKSSMTSSVPSNGMWMIIKVNMSVRMWSQE